MRQSRHVAVSVAAPAAQVYAVAADPTRLPEWAAGLAGATVERVDGEWVTDSPMGRIAVRFAPANPFGVLDHTVVLPSGEEVLNPMRVVPDGDDCEVVFTLRRRDGMSDDEFDADTRAVAADLAALRALVELV